MAAPIPPYCDSDDVISLNITATGIGKQFTHSTTPDAARVTSMIDFVSGEIDMAFANAGYIVPFTELSGETWPAYQTTWLTIVCALGTASRIFGPVIAPFGDRPGQSTVRNLFGEEYRRELGKVWDDARQRSNVRWRAQYYPFTEAESMMKTPKGPTNDVLLGVQDPGNVGSFEKFTELSWDIMKFFDEHAIQWDYAADVDATSQRFDI